MYTKKYDTPKIIDIKWQSDVKFIPKTCHIGTDGKKFYQYTAIDEASCERCIYHYKEHSLYSNIKELLFIMVINLK